MYKRVFKRAIDILAAFCGILILIIPMVIVGIIIKCDSEGPIIFKQKRLGKNKKQFVEDLNSDRLILC